MNEPDNAPTRGHTYYLARPDRVLGFQAANGALADALRAAWLERPEVAGRPPGEAALHEGVSAWIDAATGSVQVRVVLFDPAADGYAILPIDSAAIAAAIGR